MKAKSVICAIMAGLVMTGSMAALTGCSVKQGYDKLLDSDSPVTIIVWHYYNGVQQTKFDEMVSEFNNTVGVEKGIVVESVSKESIDELADSVTAAARKDPGAGELPDIFATYAETAYIVDELGCVADLKKYFTEEELDEYVESYIEEGDFNGDGSLKIFPTAKSTEVMILNKTDWQKFADDTGASLEELSTFEGVTKVAEEYYKYTDALTPDVKNDGKAFFGRDSVANYMDVGAEQLGAPFVKRDSDGKVVPGINKDAVRRLWDNYYVPFVKGYFAADSRYRSDDAKVGEIIALSCSTTGAVYFPTEVTVNDDHSYPIESVVIPAPKFEGCEPVMVQQGAGMCVVKSSEKKEYASTLFLKWFTDVERNIGFSAKSGYLPVKKEASNYDEIVSVCGRNGIEIDGTMKNTFSTAFREMKKSDMYTGPAFENSADLRSYIGDTMENTAKAAHTEAFKKIGAGADRDKTIEEYTNDKAFEVWYTDFEAGFMKVLGTAD